MLQQGAGGHSEAQRTKPVETKVPEKGHGDGLQLRMSPLQSGGQYLLLYPFPGITSSFLFCLDA